MTDKRKNAPPPKIVKLAANARPNPPKRLNRKEKALWREIVNSLPADYFRPYTFPLLSAYCQVAVWSDLLADRVAEDLTDFESGREHLKTISVLCTLATKLKLSPSSRTRSDSAKLKGKNSPRPWD